ncbi:MAG TPA: hypothetical protein VGL86_00645 [Polyangia bacterium]|jgi:hypothetical protein
MRRAVFLALLALAAPAGAQSLVLSPSELSPPPPPPPSPLAPGLPTPSTHRAEPRLLRPIPYVYRQIEHDKVNQGAVGRSNAVRSDPQSARIGWPAPPLGGNAM